MTSREYIWKDRKRILGLPISFTKYSITTDRLFCQEGLFSTNYDEVLLYRVTDISLKRTFGQKLFGVGTITVQSSDKSTPTLLLKNIKNAYRVKELLHNQVEEMKIKRRVRIGELMGSHGNDGEDSEYNLDDDM